VVVEVRRGTVAAELEVGVRPAKKGRETHDTRTHDAHARSALGEGNASGRRWSVTYLPQELGLGWPIWMSLGMLLRQKNHILIPLLFHSARNG
jgi:hypothetical protein